MSEQRQGWTHLLKLEGPDFLKWIRQKHILSSHFDVLAKALDALLLGNILTSQDAEEVWWAVPPVLACCNEQSTYEKPGAALAYAWVHLLDRYVRTWRALEILVEESCIPMGKYGVRALDVGTGPGPSALAIIDFYAAMTDYSRHKGDTRWNQPVEVTCVELDQSTNGLRDHLAEIIYQQTEHTSESVFQIGGGLTDFGEILPRQDRKEEFQRLLNAEETYFDPDEGYWTSDRLYMPDEAHDIAQSFHRYRLFTFSNFFTTVEVVDSFEGNLKDIL